MTTPKKKARRERAEESSNIQDKLTVARSRPSTVTFPTTHRNMQMSLLHWKNIERRAPSWSARPITLDDHHYPFNTWSLLTPGAIYAVLSVLSQYFILADSFRVLHLEPFEIDDVEKLLQPEKRRVWLDITEEDVFCAKRILGANVADEKLLEDLYRRLDPFSGATTCLAHIEKGMFNLFP